MTDDPNRGDELDRELRDALRAEADLSRPDPAAWDAVQGRLGRAGWHRHPWRWVVLGVAAAAVVALGVVALAWPDDDEVVTTDSTAATAPASAAPVVVTPPETAPAPTEATDTTAAVPDDTQPAPTAAPAPPGPRPAVAAAVTADGRLVVLDTSGPTAVEVRELARAGDPREEPVEGDISVLGAPVISPDGATVYYHSCCEPVVGALFRAPLDGSSPPEQLGYGSYPSLDPAGERLAFIRLSEIVVRDLATGAESVYPDPDHEGLMVDTAWSEDGRLVYYVRHAGETTELYRVDTLNGMMTGVVSSIDGEVGYRFPVEVGGVLSAVAQCCVDQVESPGNAYIQPIQFPEAGQGNAVPLPAPLDDRRAHRAWELHVDQTGALIAYGPDGFTTLGTGYLAAGW